MLYGFKMQINLNGAKNMLYFLNENTKSILPKKNVIFMCVCVCVRERI